MTNVSEWYEPEKFENIYYKGFSAYIASKFHKLLEKDRSQKFDEVLELGATHGHHVPYVKHSFDRYVLSDIRFSQSLERIALENPKFRTAIIDANNLDLLEDSSYDRVLMTCLLHHLPNPRATISGLCRIIKNHGTIDILLPNEPSAIWNLGRLIFTIPRALKNGFTWKSYWQYVDQDHVNEIQQLLPVIHEVAQDNLLKVDMSFWPIDSRYFPVKVYMRVTIHN